MPVSTLCRTPGCLLEVEAMNGREDARTPSEAGVCLRRGYAGQALLNTYVHQNILVRVRFCGLFTGKNKQNSTNQVHHDTIITIYLMF